MSRRFVVHFLLLLFVLSQPRFNSATCEIEADDGNDDSTCTDKQKQENIMLVLDDAESRRSFCESKGLTTEIKCEALIEQISRDQIDPLLAYREKLDAGISDFRIQNVLESIVQDTFLIRRKLNEVLSLYYSQEYYLQVISKYIVDQLDGEISIVKSEQQNMLKSMKDAVEVTETLDKSVASFSLRTKNISLASIIQTAIFDSIYKKKIWSSTLGNIHENNSDSKTPLSGPGSSHKLSPGIHQLVKFLSIENLMNFGISSVLDVGCGDLTWLQKLTNFCSADFPQIQYTGIDIATSVIENHRSNPRLQLCNFYAIDAAVEALPKANLVLVKDVLFHVKFVRGIQLLRNILKETNCKFILLTSSSNRDLVNTDNMDAYFAHAVNLLRPPFNFPNPELEIPHTTTDYNGVWNCSTLQNYL